jgi:beta-ribofuranosylaminobenzene 5'-phosphate synthase
MTSSPSNSSPSNSSPATSLPTTVTVTTGARIHFGLLTHRPKSGREFGGAGVMIDSPGWRISLSKSHADRVEATEAARSTHPDCVERAGQIFQRLRSTAAAAGFGGSVAVRIESAIPAHQGLGSGSQLALALARGFDQLFGGESSIADLSRQAGRGGRSAIGTWGFDLGGLLVDGGRGTDSDGLAPLVTRVAVPDDWRFLLLLPRESAGLSGDAETAAFSQLAGMPDSATDRLCRIIVMQLAPAFRVGHFHEAAAAISEYGKVAGEYFAEIQGGLFTHPRMKDLAATLAEAGGTGLAQTSWGPGCAVLCRSESMASKLVDLAQTFDASWLETAVVRGLNQGATVELS